VIAERRSEIYDFSRSLIRHATGSLGTHLNAYQIRQLCDAPWTPCLAFDTDRQGSGQRAAQHLARTLRQRGLSVRSVSLPDGHDPNRFFPAGGDARQFQALLESATQ